MKIPINLKILAGFLIVSIIPLIIGLIAISSFLKKERTEELSNLLKSKLIFKKNVFIDVITHEERDIKNILSITKLTNEAYLNNILNLIIFKSKLIKEVDIVSKNGKLINGKSYIDFMYPGEKIKIPAKKYSIEFSHNLYFLVVKSNFYNKILILKISLKDIINTIFQNNSSEFKYFIMNKNGKLLFHSNYIYVLTQRKINSFKVNQITLIKLKSLNNNIKNFISFITFLKKFNLYFGVSINKKEAFKQINSFIKRGIFIILIIFILSIIISLALSRLLSYHIKKLEEITKKIRKGNYEIEFPQRIPKDEIGELYISFELMLKTILNKIKKLNLLLNTIGDSIYVINSEYDIILINKNELRYLQKELSEVIGKKCYSIFANRSFPCPNCAIEKVKKIKEPVFYNNIDLVEKEFRKSCKRKFVNMAFYPFEHDEYLIYIKDLTQIYNILKEIEFEREKLFVTLHSIGDGVIVVDKSKKIILINNSARNILGIRINVESLPIETISPFFTNFLEEIFNEKKHIINVSEKKIKINGKKVILEISIAPIFLNQKLEGAVIVFRDITEKKKYEQEIIKKEKLEAVGMLAAGIAHDFNNILTAAIGNISLCQLYIENKQSLIEKLKTTENSLYKAKNLTEKLLTFSKGGYLIKETNDLRKIIKESMDFIISGKDIKIEYNFQKDLWPVKVDSSQLTQVFHNLALNSIDAIKKNGFIKITAQNKIISKDNMYPLKPGKYVEIIFEDNGIGINSKILNKIFDPFFTTKEKGSGLGLSTVYNIIKKHEGYIYVKSKSGKGTAFYIFLPAAKNYKKEDQKKEIREKKEIDKKLKILLMDDNNQLRETMKELLELLGHKVFTASKGEEAIEIYKKNQKNIDLVILDLTIIGGMGGKEAIKELLKINPNIKAIVSSGYSDDPVMSDYKSYGFIEKIEKPYTIKKFQEIISKLLNQL